MITAPVAWRPPCQRDLDKARALVESALDKWQARWFGRTGFVVVDVTHLRDTGISHDCADSDGLHADFAPDADCLLIEAAYTTTADVYRAPACHESLRAISTEILADLTGALRSALAPPDRIEPSKAPAIMRPAATPAFPDGAVRLTIATSNGAAFGTFVIDVRHIRSRDRIDASSPTLMAVDDLGVTRRDALDDTPVELSVLLGRCELSATALSALSIGDVITLDRPLHAPLDLIVGATGTPLALGAPGRTGSSLSIQLTSIVTRQSP